MYAIMGGTYELQTIRDGFSTSFDDHNMIVDFLLLLMHKRSE